MSVYLAALEVWLDPAIINVTEGNEARIRALLNLNSSELVTVDFVTTDGSAKSKYFHAQAQSTLTFSLKNAHTTNTQQVLSQQASMCHDSYVLPPHEMQMALTIWRG